MSWNLLLILVLGFWFCSAVGIQNASIEWVNVVIAKGYGFYKCGCGTERNLEGKGRTKLKVILAEFSQR